MTYSALMTVLGHRVSYFLLIGVGGLVGLLFLYLDNEDRTIRNTYKKTTCKIEQADVEVDEQMTGRGSRRHVTRTYYPNVVYSYSIDGTDYEGNVYRAFEMGMDEAEATTVVARYGEGASVTCYYDPGNPEDAVLTLDSDRSLANTTAAIGLLFLFAGLAGWVVIDFVLPTANKASKPSQQDFTAQLPEWSAQPAHLNADLTRDGGGAAISSGPR